MNRKNKARLQQLTRDFQEYHIPSGMGGVWLVECVGCEVDSGLYVYENRNSQYEAGPWHLDAKQVLNIVQEIKG